MSLNTEHLSPCRNLLEESSNNYHFTLEYVFLKLLTERNTKCIPTFPLQQLKISTDAGITIHSSNRAIKQTLASFTHKAHNIKII